MKIVSNRTMGKNQMKPIIFTVSRFSLHSNFLQNGCMYFNEILLQIFVLIEPTPPRHEQDVIQEQFLRKVSFNSVYLLYDQWPNKAKELSLPYYLPIVE